MALVKIFSILGRSVDISQCKELAGTDPNGSTTMHGLQVAAEILGQKTKAMHLTAEELAFLNCPAILNVSTPKGEHFTVFSSGNNGIFELVDPGDNAKAYLTSDQLELMWQGKSLVFTDHPFFVSLTVGMWRIRTLAIIIVSIILGLLSYKFISRIMLVNKILEKVKVAPRSGKYVVMGLILLISFCVLSVLFCIRAIIVVKSHLPQKPSLLLGVSKVNIGSIENKANVVNTAIWIANNGGKVLDIDEKNIKASCKCLKVKLSKSKLQPKEKTSMHIRLRPPRSQIGPFKYLVYIPTNSTPEKGNVLTIEGEVTGAGGVVYPPRLYFGRFTSLDETRKTIKYIVRREGIEVINISSDLPFVESNFETTSEGFKVNIWLTKTPEPEVFEGIITVYTNDPVQPVVEVPYSGQYVMNKNIYSSTTTLQKIKEFRRHVDNSF